jgi:nucleoid DNA-binding protein
VKLGKYIRELILENDTVIIPGFGAFISNYKPSEIDEQNHKILPPAKEISFTQKIRNNDGMLVGYIAAHEKTSHFEALQKIEQEREKLLYQLDKEGKVEVEEAGTFYYDNKHEIQFEAEKSTKQNLDAFGLAPVSLPDSFGQDPAIDKMANNESIEELTDKKNKNNPEFVSVEESESWKNKDKSENRSRLWWLLLLLIPVVGAGYYFFFFEKNELPKTVETETNLPVEQPIIPPEEENIVLDSASSDSVKIYIETPVSEKKDSSLFKIDSLPGFYLITGSFKEEKNVAKYIAKMKNEGFEPFYLGKKGNFYLVGIGWYKTEREALIAQDSFLAKNPDSGAWVHIE